MLFSDRIVFTRKNSVSRINVTISKSSLKLPNHADKMSEKKPFFSVVMPTRNRAKLLPFAIQSLLNQTFDDFEIIISDNFSSDETPQIARSFDDKRIKYFRSDKALSINDSFEFALSHAIGEYISFLPDDDAFTPNALERVKQIIDDHQAEIVAFHYCFYNYDTNFVAGFEAPANSLTIRDFSGKLKKFSPAEGIKNLFSNYELNKEPLDDLFIVPILANAIYNRSVFSRVAKTKKKMFASTPADMYLAAAIFFVIDSYFCLDEPMHVWSQWSDNVTASPHRKGNQLKAHYERLLNGEKPRFTPVKYAFRLNLDVNSMLEAKNDFGAKSPESEIDWESYFLAQHYDLERLKKIGIDVSAEERELKDALAKQPKELKGQVRATISSNAAKQLLNENLPETVASLLKLAKRKIQGESAVTVERRKHKGFAVISGEDAGFHNVVDAARVLSDEILDQLRGKQNLIKPV